MSRVFIPSEARLATTAEGVIEFRRYRTDKPIVIRRKNDPKLFDNIRRKITNNFQWKRHTEDFPRGWYWQWASKVEGLDGITYIKAEL